MFDSAGSTVNKVLHGAVGHLQDAEGDMGFEALNTDNVSPEPPARHMPWTQQPSEAQLPQTQQQFSPNMEMVGISSYRRTTWKWHWTIDNNGAQHLPTLI